ncbi:MAG: hypothetical protein DPW22_11970, partial [Alphaproteobacteria bacterium]|nr:hypothetical protein [Alphaproteobacteria bacterium]
ALAAYDAHRRDARNRETFGLAARNEVLAVEVERSRADLLRLEAGNLAAEAEANLARLIGAAPGARVEPAESLAAPVVVPELEPLVAEALASRPERAALTARVEGASARTRAEAAGALPQVALAAGFDYANPNRRILPPKDACLWISSQYVRRLGDGPTATTRPATTRAAASEPDTPRSQPSDADIVTSLAEETSVARDEVPRTAASDAVSPTTQPVEGEGARVTIRTGRGRAAERIAQYLQESGPRGVRVQQLEDELRGLLEAATSADTAALERLRQEYEAITGQEEEPSAQAVARARVRQINSRVELLGSRARILDEQKDLDIYRRQLGEDRSRIGLRASAASQPAYDFKGELRVSPLFTESQRRYRLVNPAEGGRTIAYVDLPVELSGNIPQWVGQYVGVRARSRVFDAALRLPVVAAEWIDVIDPKTGVPTSAPATQADN